MNTIKKVICSLVINTIGLTGCAVVPTGPGYLVQPWNVPVIDYAPSTPSVISTTMTTSNNGNMQNITTTIK